MNIRRILLMASLLLLLPGHRLIADEQAGVYDYQVNTLEGEQIDLSRFRGQVLLIVNTASKCGFTPQYRELEELYNMYREKGFTVLAFPSNDFGKQEPGTNQEIRNFCTQTFGITFPVMCKLPVTGDEKQPLFQFLTENSPEEFQGEIGWNFEKFLIDRKGQVRARFSSFINPMSTRLRDNLEELLLESP